MIDSETWVTLIGVQLRVVRRSDNAVGFRTPEGWGYVLDPVPPRLMTYIHDVDLPRLGRLFVYAAQRRVVPGKHLECPQGVIVLGTSEQAWALSRSDRFDGAAASRVVPKERVKLDIPVHLMDDVRAQAERSGRTLNDELVFLVGVGLRRLETVAKYKQGRAKDGADRAAR